MEELSVKDIQNALEVMGLPVFISLKELKLRYRELALKHHPDRTKKSDMMLKINQSYEVLKKYMENYRFTFSDEEIIKQCPRDEYALRFGF